ncbi:hypothetical protein ADEAN_000266600 [Angomonas deanei]|uniref:Uncharacterized protein n=1 Tax=Angomonas deanei TaxID=59799 RepID=A0A7G2C853_9TRYP|nr:hypothetical protein ADEAN_000266600 [Angomonas deanei]
MAEYDFGDYDFQAAFGSGTALQSDDATQDTPAASNNNNKRGRSKENGLPAFVAPPLDKDSLSESGDSSRNTRRRGNSQIHPVPAKLKDDGKPASENIVLPNIDAAHKRQGSASPSAVAKNNNYLNNVTIDDSSPSKNNGWVKETAKRFETPPSSNNNSVNKRPAEDAMIPKGTVASRAAVFNNLSWNDDYDMQTALHSSGSNLSSNLLPMKSTVPMTELHEKMNKRNPMKFTPPLSKNNPPPKPRSDAETVASEVAPLLHARKTTGTSPSVSNATTSNNNKVVGKPPSAPPRQALASPQVTTNKTTTNSSNGVTPRKSSETTSNDSKPTARAAARSLPIGNNKKEATNTVSQDSGSTHQATPTTSQDGSSKIIANTHNDSPAKYDNKQPCTNHRYTQAQREKLLQWMDYGALRYPIAAPGENVTTTTAASHPNIYRKTETTTAEQRYSYSHAWHRLRRAGG